MKTYIIKNIKKNKILKKNLSYLNLYFHTLINIEMSILFKKSHQQQYNYNNTLFKDLLFSFKRLSFKINKYKLISLHKITFYFIKNSFKS